MYFTPSSKLFHPAEFFPKSASLQLFSNQIWRLIDDRVLWTAEQIRKRYGVTIINDYLWGGNNQYRAYRPIPELLEVNKTRSNKFSLTSQHCFGRAIDCKFRDWTAEEVRQDIKKNPKHDVFKFITRVEDKVDWFHFDCASWTGKEILFFDP
jgi:hypothetical protein